MVLIRKERPQLGDYYWVALTPYKIFTVQYNADELDEQWFDEGVAYLSKQDAREALGLGKPLPSGLDAVREVLDTINLVDYPNLSFVVRAIDGRGKVIQIAKGSMEGIFKLFSLEEG